MRKKKALLYFISVWGFLCLLVFVITKSEYLMSKLTITGNPYGNLYKNCKVSIFKIPMEPTKPPPASCNSLPIDSCDIIIIGDSFVSECPGHYYFGVELSSILNRPVYQLEIKPDLFYELNRSGISHVDRQRLFIFESGESGILKNFVRVPDLRPVHDPKWNANAGDVTTQSQSWLMKIRQRWFVGTEKNYSYFIETVDLF